MGTYVTYRQILNIDPCTKAAWRQIARIDKKIPPSWKLADLAITAGLRGILFPSLRYAGGTNLVIFPANLVEGDKVTVHDPDHRLPPNQSSWP